ncbi:unnamed protein product, partial [Staurois parvus]
MTEWGQHMLKGWAWPLSFSKENSLAYQDILDNFMLLALWVEFGD